MSTSSRRNTCVTKNATQEKDLHHPLESGKMAGRSRAPLTRLGDLRNDAGKSEDKTDTGRTLRVW